MNNEGHYRSSELLYLLTNNMPLPIGDNNVSFTISELLLILDCTRLPMTLISPLVSIKDLN